MQTMQTDNKQTVNNYIHRNSFAIVSGYTKDQLITQMGVISELTNQIEIHFPKGNLFFAGQKISVYSDNRTGVEEFDHNVNIFRISLKGTVKQSADFSALIDIDFYELFYGTHIIEKYSRPGYNHPVDQRRIIPLPESLLSVDMVKENLIIDNNQVGVFVTKGTDRPHSSVMAYLSTDNDDIFIISHRGSFKSENIIRDRNCTFTLDHRAEISFEKAVFWNFSVFKGKIYSISKSNPLFPVIQAAFVEKNPWERVFFTHDNIEMFHIRPEGLIYPDKYFRYCPYYSELVSSSLKKLA